MSFLRSDFGGARDGARIGLQSAVAAAVAWLVIGALLPPHASWAVISAIFVVSQSAGGTLQAALGRTLGTIAGTVLGIVSVLLLGGEANTALRVALAAFAGAMLATIKPAWRYGIVAAVIVALEQDRAVLGGAMARGLAILIGVGAGVAASFLVWRESAESRTARALSRALAGCRELLEAGLEAVAGADEDLEPAHRQVSENLRQAREEASSASRGMRPVLEQRVKAVQRLWHALIIIDRAARKEQPLQEVDSAELEAAIGRVKNAAAERLAQLNMAGESNIEPGGDRLARAVKEAVALSCSASSAADASRETITLGGLAFALAEVENNIRELEEAVERSE